jgi:hypothetical protein
MWHIRSRTFRSPLFRQEREVVVRSNSLLMLEQPFMPLLPGERPSW